MEIYHRAVAIVHQEEPVGPEGSEGPEGPYFLFPDWFGETKSFLIIHRCQRLLSINRDLL